MCGLKSVDRSGPAANGCAPPQQEKKMNLPPRKADNATAPPPHPASAEAAPADSAASGPPAETRQSPRRDRSPRWGGLVVAAVCLVGIGLAQAAAPASDNQLMNLVSYVLAAVALGALAIRSLRRPGVSGAKRLLPVDVALAVLVGFFSLFRIAGVTGELEPIFRFRFAPQAALPTLADQQPSGADQESSTADQDLAAIGSGDEQFPGFLGADRDGVIPQRQFSTAWNERPPQRRWRQPIGQGWSGFAIAGRLGVTLEQRDEEEWISCYDLRDGALLWKHAEPGRHAHVMGGVGPRSTPTLAGGLVYAQTALGQLVCLDLTDGTPRWRIDLLARGGLDQGSAEDNVTWGRAGSPLLVDQQVVVPFGGAVDPQDRSQGIAGLIAFDAASGDELWTGGSSQISYASPIVATLDGQRQIVSVNEADVSGHRIDTGQVLWQASWPGSSSGTANCASPVVYGEDGILVGKGYGGGSMLLRISEASDRAGQQTSIVWDSRRVLKTKFTNAVVRGDFAYALSDGFLECVDLRDGSRQWRQPRSSRYGQGQVLRVEDVLLVQAEMGDVAVVACDPAAFDEL